MTKSITLDRWNFGLDVRKGQSTSDANRLRVLTNAYITEGATVRKRPGCLLVATLEAGTTGLAAGRGKLNTFYGGTGTINHANPLFQANNTRNPTNPTNAVVDIGYADVFNGFVYVSVKYADGTNRHHYLDGAAPGSTHIADTNCPNTPQATKIASKVWSVSTTGDTVRYCATNAPRDWTTINNAGFLPVGLQQSGATKATALGSYQNRLVVFFADSSQVWQVDVDPAKHLFLQTVDIGTTLPFAHQNMAGDVFFYSPAGVRTITAQENTTNLIDADVGSPIDRELTAGTIINTATAKGQYYRGGGQYWLYSGNKAAVYTFSRSNKVSAWSVYEFPFTLDYLDELDADLYIRSGNNVYKVTNTVKTDNGVVYPVTIEMAYLDFKAPGILKQITGMDVVITGNCTVAHRYDPRSTALITDPPVAIVGDTRPGYLIPVELMATNIATVIKNNDSSEFELHQLGFLFEGLGPL